MRSRYRVSCSTPSISPRRLISIATCCRDVVAGQDVDRADRRHVLAPDQAPPVTEGVDVLGEELLEVGLDPVLDQPGVDPEVVLRVVENLVQAYPKPVLGLGVLHDPHQRDPVGRLLGRRRDLRHRARRRHPVQRLVRAAVAVHQHRPVGLDHEQAGRQRQVGRQPPVVVDAAPGDDETHRGSLSHPTKFSAPLRYFAGTPTTFVTTSSDAQRTLSSSGSGRAAVVLGGAGGGGAHARRPGRRLAAVPSHLGGDRHTASLAEDSRWAQTGSGHVSMLAEPGQQVQPPV